MTYIYMSLYHTRDEVLKKLQNKKYTIPREELIQRIEESMDRSLDFLSHLITGEQTGFERDVSNKNNTNPMLWEFGHVLFFWEHKTLRFLESKEYCDLISLENSQDIYDSFIVNAEERRQIKLYDAKEVVDRYIKTITKIIHLLEDSKFEYDPIRSYLIHLSLIHNEMHNESYLFSQKMLCLNKKTDRMIFGKPSSLPDMQYDMTETVQHEMIEISGGTFRQGAKDDSEYFVFDNEMPEFEKTIKPFRVSKYPITETQFFEFVKAGGYSEEKYWTKPGWRWRVKNDITHPMYWSSYAFTDKFYTLIWTNNGFTRRPLRQNMPMVHISWYEAKAYCAWRGVRLLTESEWEFMAKDFSAVGNLNYLYGDVAPVNIFETDEGVSQLFGNIWEWCEEPIYPYDGFVIDPVYREMSYPYFGFKKICRGGSWACPSYLISATYRNAQMPDNRMQFIGFRVVEDIE
jgi:ergothioneine biosynthesis protein EgtB